MSRVRRRISRVIGGPSWGQCWLPVDEAMTQPPTAAESYAADTGFLAWYLPSSIAGFDPSSGFWNTFNNRVAEWEVDPQNGGPPVCEFDITVGPNEPGVTDPLIAGFSSVPGPGWVFLSGPTATTDGSRSALINNEQKLPNDNMETITELEGNFKYRIEVDYRYEPGGIPTNAQLHVEYVIQYLGDGSLLYNAGSYVPCVHYFRWVYGDDGGQAAGGFVSMFNEMQGNNPAIVSDDIAFTSVWRYGKRPMGSTEHIGVAFNAWKFDSECADFSTSGNRTTTSAIAPEELELDGILVPAEAWIQPVTDGYIPYRWDNGDPASALYDIANGACLVPDADFPTTMTEQVP